MDEKYLFEMNHVTKRFPGVVALKDVTFKVKTGSIHGLVGENGAGKIYLDENPCRDLSLWHL